MQCSEYQMPCLGGLDGDRDGFQIAQLADENDIRILAQGGAKRIPKRHGVKPDLPLCNDASLVRVDELDRILDGDDVIRAGAIHEIDECAQGGRFSGACGSRYKNESLRQEAE